MDKANEASAPPPNSGYPDAPPPYPGTNPGPYSQPPGQPPVGVFQHPGPVPVQNAPPLAAAPSYPMPPSGGGVPYGQPTTQQPPPMQPMPPMQGALGQTVVVTTPVRYGKESTTMRCFHCQAQIQTSTSAKPGAAAWAAFGTMFCCGFIVGFTWLCCCIPFCIPDFQEVEHTCPSCNKYLGRYKMM